MPVARPAAAGPGHSLRVLPIGLPFSRVTFLNWPMAPPLAPAAALVPHQLAVQDGVRWRACVRSYDPSPPGAPSGPGRASGCTVRPAGELVAFDCTPRDLVQILGLVDSKICLQVNLPVTCPSAGYRLTECLFSCFLSKSQCFLGHDFALKLHKP